MILNLRHVILAGVPFTDGELVQKWLTADFSATRQLLEIVFLNFKLDGINLSYETRKPFDVLAKGLSVRWNRGDGTPVDLFVKRLVGFERSLA